MSARRKGTPIVVSAASGTGKTTLCRGVMEQLGGIAFSVSHTTRSPRGTEVDGRDYHFVSDARFQEMIDAGEFLEWAEVHGNKYGTHRATTMALLDDGIDVFFDIDVQGGIQIKEQLPQTVLLFVTAPSFEELERRLRDRGTDTPDVIERRLAAARGEQELAEEHYDEWIINDDLEAATRKLEALVRRHRAP